MRLSRYFVNGAVKRLIIHDAKGFNPEAYLNQNVFAVFRELISIGDCFSQKALIFETILKFIMTLTACHAN